MQRPRHPDATVHNPTHYPVTTSQSTHVLVAVHAAPEALLFTGTEARSGVGDAGLETEGERESRGELSLGHATLRLDKPTVAHRVPVAVSGRRWEVC